MPQSRSLQPMRQENYEKRPEARMRRALEYLGLIVPSTNIQASLLLKQYLTDGTGLLLRDGTPGPRPDYAKLKYSEWKKTERVRRRLNVMSLMLRTFYRGTMTVEEVLRDAASRTATQPR